MPTRATAVSRRSIPLTDDLSLLREAIIIAADPSARLELTMRVRRARPVAMRTLLLHGLVRYLHDRCEHARRIEAATKVTHTWATLFPELPATLDDGRLTATLQLMEVAG